MKTLLKNSSMPHVLYSKVLEAPADQVWALVRTFDALPQWMPFIAACDLKDGARPDQVGAVRVITRADGAVVEETLLELSDRHQRIGFTISKGDVPMRNTYATITVHEVTADGRAYVEWQAQFDVEGDPDPIAAWVVNEFYRPCLEELERVVKTAQQAR